VKRILSVFLFSLLTCTLANAQANEEATAALNLGNKRFQEGNFVEAQKHFERAYELDSSIENIRMLIARSLLRQYKPAVEEPDNLAKAKAAVQAYEAILADDGANEEAFNAGLFLYRQMKDEAMERQWLMRHATNASVPAEKRATIYVLLATKQRECSSAVTEANRKTVRDGRKSIVRYVKPEVESDFNRARDCALEGLNLAEMASTLNPYSAAVWSEKANLLREMVKLSEMQNDAAQKAHYEQQIATAVETQQRLTQKPGSEGPSAAPAATDASSVDSRRTAPISGGVLNSKAISKPMPAYPQAAINERVQGLVTVKVLVDEEGKVISATAVGGHKLLFEAAVEAAKRARFSPTTLSGQPVKVSGVLTYNFRL
jgi:TonB family protein